MSTVSFASETKYSVSPSTCLRVGIVSPVITLIAGSGSPEARVMRRVLTSLFVSSVVYGRYVALGVGMPHSKHSGHWICDELLVEIQHIRHWDHGISCMAS